MNYLEIINKCLTELNYKNVTHFSELIKNEHKKLKNIINVLHAEICFCENWPFMLQHITLVLPQGQGSLLNPCKGKIAYLRIGNNTLHNISNFESFFTNSQPQNTFSLLNETILLPQYDKDVEVEIFYYSKDGVKSIDGEMKSSFEFADDETLIPTPFAEPLLVYGACMRLKGNPQHIRFSFWLSMYNSALANMRAYCKSVDDCLPAVRLVRGE